MKKFYIISNYITALYELDEAGLCKIKGQNSITIDEVIENFKKNVSVKAFGIIRAYIQEHTEDGKWIVINDIIPPKNRNNTENPTDIRRSFSFTHDDLKQAFEAGRKYTTDAFNEEHWDFDYDDFKSWYSEKYD